MKIAIIPARGGSKRVPRKNIRLFCGKPLLAYPLIEAAESGCFDRIIVSTDSDEVAAVAREYGAEVPFVRPVDLSTDQVGIGPVIRHTLEWLAANGCHPDFVCQVFATAPFLRGEDLREGLGLLEASPEKEYAMAVATFGFPIQRAARMTVNGGLEPMQPECMGMRSQDLEEAYHEAAHFTWGRTGAFLRRLAFYAPHTIPIMVPRYLVQDIDTEEDWKRAELLYQVLQAGRQAEG